VISQHHSVTGGEELKSSSIVTDNAQRVDADVDAVSSALSEGLKQP